MTAVRTTPDGVCTAKACVIVPSFFTVIVILTACAAAGPAGVILHSVSLTLTWEPPAAGAWEDEVGAELAAGLDEVLELLLEDEPQPAIRAASTNGARWIWRLMLT